MQTKLESLTDETCLLNPRKQSSLGGFNFFLFFLLFTLNSCNLDIWSSESVVENFLDELENNKGGDLLNFYPELYLLDSYLITKNSKVVSSKKLSDNVIRIETTTSFIKKSGNEVNGKVSYFLRKDISGNFIIFDSQGLFAFKESEYYNIIESSGLINMEDSTDISNSEIIGSLAGCFTSMISSLTDYNRMIRTSDLKWEISDNSNFAKGGGIVFNASIHSYPNLKYRIDFLNTAGDTLTTKKGYVTYDEFKPRDKLSFNFYADYVGKANSVRISYFSEEEDIRRYVFQTKDKYIGCFESLDKSRLIYRSEKKVDRLIEIEKMLESER